jgi:hypothetical protein
MPEFTYKVEYEHGIAEGSIVADSKAAAEDAAKAMYQGLEFDTFDESGNPVRGVTAVTKVTVTKVEGSIY